MYLPFVGREFYFSQPKRRWAFMMREQRIITRIVLDHVCLCFTYYSTAVYLYLFLAHSENKLLIHTSNFITRAYWERYVGETVLIKNILVIIHAYEKLGV